MKGAKMRQYTTILLAACAMALLASLAFAGYFTSNGRVYPIQGPVNIQFFVWSVEYNLDQNQPPPEGWVMIWKYGVLKYDEMMDYTDVNGIVYYSFGTTLDQTGIDYTYQFYTFDDYTLVGVGPDVY